MPRKYIKEANIPDSLVREFVYKKLWESARVSTAEAIRKRNREITQLIKLDHLLLEEIAKNERCDGRPGDDGSIE